MPFAEFVVGFWVFSDLKLCKTVRGPGVPPVRGLGGAARAKAGALECRAGEVIRARGMLLLRGFFAVASHELLDQQDGDRELRDHEQGDQDDQLGAALQSRELSWWCDEEVDEGDDGHYRENDDECMLLHGNSTFSSVDQGLVLSTLAGLPARVNAFGGKSKVNF